MGMDSDRINDLSNILVNYQYDLHYLKRALSPVKFYEFLETYLEDSQNWYDFMYNYLDSDPSDVLETWDWRCLSREQFLAIQCHPYEIPHFVYEVNRVIVEYFTVVGGNDKPLCRQCAELVKPPNTVLRTVIKYIKCDGESIMDDVLLDTDNYWCNLCKLAALFKIYNAESMYH